MFGLSFWEIVVTALVALLVFGPDKLPELAKQGGKFFGHFRKTTDSLRRDFYNAVYSPSEEVSRLKDAARRELLAISTKPAPTTTTQIPCDPLNQPAAAVTEDEDELGENLDKSQTKDTSTSKEPS